MEIAGLPLHPLVVHAVVVLAPIAALVAIAYALFPSWRWALRWILIATAVIATTAGVIAASSGESLLDSLPGLKESASMETHEERGELLRNVLLVFVVLAGIACWRLGGPSGLVSGKGAKSRHGGAIDTAVSVLLTIAAIAVLAATFFAGHTGAVVVWG